MKYLATLLLILGFGLSAFGQTIKSLGYNTTNGEVVANIGTNVLKFTNNITLDAGEESMQFRITATGVAIFSGAAGGDILFIPNDDIPIFSPNYYWSEPSVRAAFGFSTNLNTLWTATNASNARSAVGLGSTNTPSFRRVVVDPNASGALGVQYGTNDSGIYNGGTYNQLSLRVGGINALTAETNGVTFASPAAVRTNLGLGGGITTNRTFVSYNGTNYTTNTVTISNGIVTGWTQ